MVVIQPFSGLMTFRAVTQGRPSPNSPNRANLGLNDPIPLGLRKAPFEAPYAACIVPLKTAKNHDKSPGYYRFLRNKLAR
jgi:hypothetical protein